MGCGNWWRKKWACEVGATPRARHHLDQKGKVAHKSEYGASSGRAIPPVRRAGAGCGHPGLPWADYLRLWAGAIDKMVGGSAGRFLGAYLLELAAQAEAISATSPAEHERLRKRRPSGRLPGSSPRGRDRAAQPLDDDPGPGRQLRGCETFVIHTLILMNTIDATGDSKDS